jgi:hypothetical protein
VQIVVATTLCDQCNAQLTLVVVVVVVGVCDAEEVLALRRRVVRVRSPRARISGARRVDEQVVDRRDAVDVVH